MSEEHRRGDFEQRAQSIVQAIIMAMVLWVGYTVLGLRESSIKQEFQNVQTSKDITALQAELAALRTQIVTISLSASQTATSAAALAASVKGAKDKP